MKNELRIRNYVNVPTQPTPVQIVCAIMPAHAGTSHTIEHLELGGYLTPYELIEPIPLTEEWLLKLGFKYFLDTKIYAIDNFFIEKEPDNKIAVMYDYLNKSVEYVHQLQNLYFALTGEELVCQ